jgi:transposase
MARKALTMTKLHEIDRLFNLACSERQIARSVNVSRTTVRKYLALKSKSLPIQLKPPAWFDTFSWSEVNSEVENGVPLKVLWEEYFEQKKISVDYPQFWKHYTKRFPDKKLTMVRKFEPGSSVEIDYCDGIELIDPNTGEILKTQLFMGCLCFSRYVFAEFTMSQKSEDFLNSHVKMFKFFGGTPATVTPDNLKSAVSRTHLYDPDINPAYSRLAEHYSIVVTPARVRHPQDKAIVERSIQIFQRWFYHRVRKITFTSLVELNKSLQEHLTLFHQKKHRIFKKTRQLMFSEEKSFLKTLPEVDYLVMTHKKARPHSDCHLQFEDNFYSTPYQYRGQEVDVWATENTVEIYCKQERLAVHSRIKVRGKFITNKDHYPPEYVAYLEDTPTSLRARAKKFGENTSLVMEKLLSGPYPLRHIRRAQGLMALTKKYQTDRVEYAMAIALEVNKIQIHYIEKIARLPINIEKIKEVERLSNEFLRGDELYQ